MNKLNHFFTTIVATLLAFSLLLPNVAYASNGLFDSTKISNAVSLKENDYCLFEYKGHGEFLLKGEGYEEEFLNASIEFINIGDFVCAQLIDDSLFYLENEKYLLHADNDIYTLSDKLVIDYHNPKKSFDEYDLYDISEQIKELVLKEIDAKNDIFDDSYCIEIFVPSFIQTNNVSVSDPGAGDASTSNYSYGGYTLKTEVIRVTDTRTMIDEQANAYDVAINFVSLGIALTGATGVVVDLWGIATSAYALYASSLGNVGSGSNDYLNVVMSYRQYKKLTSVKDAYTWKPGVYSQRVVLGQIAGTERYGDSLQFVQRTEDIDITTYTTNYYSPSGAAINNVTNLGIALHDSYPYFIASYTGANNNSVSKTFFFVY